MAHGDRARICFVTGTRAEFGLMRSTLLAIAAHPRLHLQIVATGMHLDRERGHSLDTIRADGWHIDRVVPWDSAASSTPVGAARCTGTAMAGVAAALDELRSDVVLVVGDRVEAFAAAAAGHVSGRIVAHVHGGDRAAGQVDDALRHAITKLAHVHFPATLASAKRIRRLGEDTWRIHRVGSPGIDGITRAAAPRSDVAADVGPLNWRRYALLVLHPVDADEAVEQERAETVLKAAASIPQIVIIYPNNDPGSGGIVRAWEEMNTSLLPLSGERNTDRTPARACHPERSEGSLSFATEETLRCAQGDGLKPSIHLPGRARKTAETEYLDSRIRIRRDVPRPVFLGLLRDAAVLIGNSSAGIIEAASFATPVVDIGPRQKGREHGRNVTHVPCSGPAIRRALRDIWNGGHPRRALGGNVYGTGGAGKKIAAALAGLKLNERLRRKLIAY